MLTNWTMTKILKLIEFPSTTKEYNFNQFSCINSKPSLQVGCENLLRFEINLPLYYSMCNPKKVIETIEDTAKSREPFDWVYQGRYMGQFVINNVSKSLNRVLKDTILFAEVTFSLLENPLPDEFLDQYETTVDLSNLTQYSSTSEALSAIVPTVKDTVLENFSSMLNSALNSDSLSDTAKNLGTSIVNEIVSDTFDVANLYDTVSNYASSLSNSALDDIDVTALSDFVTSIPDKLLDVSIRSGL
ncbi:MAG: phage tail protein [Candidatus Gastranaerophilales bacterium]|nr:phage tail protein [Candidatus Gastranaerophilales bacterium]